MKQIFLEYIQNPIIITALVILTLGGFYFLFKDKEKKFTKIFFFFFIVTLIAEVVAYIFSGLSIKYTGILLNFCPLIFIIVAVPAYIIIIQCYKVLIIFFKTAFQSIE